MNLGYEFNRFHVRLMNGAPAGFVPHYFPITRGGKIPAALAIVKRAGPKPVCCENAAWVVNAEGKVVCSGCGVSKGSWKAPYARLSSFEALQRIKAGSNVALGAMENDRLQPVDADDDEIYLQFKPTLQTKGRSRTGGHAWYFAAEGETKLPANIPTGQGEARGVGQYIVCPGSHVSTTREELTELVAKKKISQREMDKALVDPALGFYTVDLEMPAQSIVFAELPAIYREKCENDVKIAENQKLLPKFEPKQANGRHSALFDLQITDLVSPSKCNERFPHPLHDSCTGQNFSISGNLGHCWRHMCSLNALQFLVVKSGYMPCEEAGTRHGGGASKVAGDDGAEFFAWCEAKRMGVISEDDALPINALHFIARKHKVCSEDRIPARGEFGKKKLPLAAYKKVLAIVEEEY